MAVPDTRDRNSVGLVHLAQRIPASVVEPELLNTMVAAVLPAAIGVFAVLEELGEPEVVDAAVAAVEAPVVADLLHHVAGREALVAPDLQSIEVEAFDPEGGDCGAEGRHFAPGGAETLHGVGAVRRTVDSAVVVAPRRDEEVLAIPVEDVVGVRVIRVRARPPGGVGALPEA